MAKKCIAFLLALMGRVRLIEASPWYNGNEFYADWKRSDGTNFMPQVKDESKWGTAALLAKRLIKGSEAGSFKYKLHTVERKLRQLSGQCAGDKTDSNRRKRQTELRCQGQSGQRKGRRKQQPWSKFLSERLEYKSKRR